MENFHKAIEAIYWFFSCMTHALVGVTLQLLLESLVLA